MQCRRGKGWAMRVAMGWTMAAVLAPSAQAAPVSGSSDKPSAHRPTQRAQAVAPEDTSNFCDAHHIRAGWQIGFAMVKLGVNSTQSATPGSDVAGAVSYADIISYLTHDYVQESALVHTGSLRWSLWAVPQNHVAGWPKISGHRMGGFVPQLRDGNGQVNNYMYNLTEVTFRERVATVNPPAGRYCLAFMVEMYSTNNECKSADGYCPEIVYTLTPAVTFR